MTKHPVTLLSTERYSSGVPELNLFVDGKKAWKTVIDAEKKNDMSDLKGRRDEAIGKLSGNKKKEPWNKKDVAKAVFLAAAYRDARYSAGGRRYHQHLGFANMVRGFYEGAKLAVDHSLD